MQKKTSSKFPDDLGKWPAKLHNVPRAKEPNFSCLAPESGQEATMYFYDRIGGFGIWAEDIVDALRNMRDNTALTLRFHSDGGDMQEAAAIDAVLGSALETGKLSSIKSMVDGRAFSVATYLALRGEYITAAPMALWMVHPPRATVHGVAEELADGAVILESLKENLIDRYVSKTGKEKDEIACLVNGKNNKDGTMMSAVQALDFGFIDEVTDKNPEPQVTDDAFENLVSSFFEDGRGSEPLKFLNFYWKAPTWNGRIKTASHERAKRIESARKTLQSIAVMQTEAIGD